MRFAVFKEHPDELLFTIWSDETSGSVTGSVIAYANGQKYSIPFSGATAADDRDAATLPTPIVVRFPAPMMFESAYVGALNGEPCPVHAPAVAGNLQTYVQRYGTSNIQDYPAWKQAWPAFLARASGIDPIAAGNGDPEEPLSCPKPYVMAYTKTTAPVEAPFAYDAEVVVRLIVGPDGSVLGTRVDRRGRIPIFDEIARDAAEKSSFYPQIYRCAPVSGIYGFIVIYSSR